MDSIMFYVLILHTLHFMLNVLIPKSYLLQSILSSFDFFSLVWKLLGFWKVDCAPYVKCANLN